MAEDAAAEQRAKREAAAAYDYEGDGRWADYWSNILIPPHLVSSSDVLTHYKRKFYQRFIDPDMVVEAKPPVPISSQPAASPGPSNPARSTARSSPEPSGNQTRTRSSGSAPGGAGSQGGSTNALQLDRRTIQFSVNAWVFVVAMLGTLPLMPKHLSKKAYRLSMLGTVCSSAYSLYTLYGKPHAWNLPAVQTWFQTIIVAKDFIHLLYCIMFVSSQMHFKLASIPVLWWALEHVAKFLRLNFGRSSFYRRYLEGPCLWVEANTTMLNISISHCEIALGFLLFVSIISWQRNILQTFMYWQLLKLMYHAPVTASYHQSVWASIGRTTSPYIQRYAPILNTPISVVQRWWFR